MSPAPPRIWPRLRKSAPDAPSSLSGRAGVILPATATGKTGPADSQSGSWGGPVSAGLSGRLSRGGSRKPSFDAASTHGSDGAGSPEAGVEDGSEKKTSPYCLETTAWGAWDKLWTAARIAEGRPLAAASLCVRSFAGCGASSVAGMAAWICGCSGMANKSPASPSSASGTGKLLTKRALSSSARVAREMPPKSVGAGRRETGWARAADSACKLKAVSNGSTGQDWEARDVSGWRSGSMAEPPGGGRLHAAPLVPALSWGPGKSRAKPVNEPAMPESNDDTASGRGIVSGKAMKWNDELKSQRCKAGLPSHLFPSCHHVQIQFPLPDKMCSSVSRVTGQWSDP